MTYKNRPNAEQLKEDYEKLGSTKKIGEKYSVVKNTINNWMREDKIKRNKSSYQISLEKRPSTEQLKEDYEKLESTPKVGEKYGVSSTTVGNWMEEDCIVRRKSPSQISLEKRPNKEQLKEDYEELRSTTKVAKKYNVSGSTIYRWMKDDKIERNKSSYQISLGKRIQKKPSKEQLEKDYEKLGSTAKVAKKYAVSQATAYDWIKMYGIETKKQKSNHLEKAVQDYIGK